MGMDLVEKDPLLAIDYLRRAYLIQGDEQHNQDAMQILKSMHD